MTEDKPKSHGRLSIRPTLTPRDLMAETVRAADGRVPVVAGIISNSTS